MGKTFLLTHNNLVVSDMNFRIFLVSILLLVLVAVQSCNQVIKRDCNEVHFRCLRNCVIFEDNQQQFEACQDICDENYKECKSSNR